MALECACRDDVANAGRALHNPFVTSPKAAANNPTRSAPSRFPALLHQPRVARAGTAGTLTASRLWLVSEDGGAVSLKTLLNGEMHVAHVVDVLARSCMSYNRCFVGR